MQSSKFALPLSRSTTPEFDPTVRLGMALGFAALFGIRSCVLNRLPRRTDILVEEIKKYVEETLCGFDLLDVFDDVFTRTNLADLNFRRPAKHALSTLLKLYNVNKEYIKFLQKKRNLFFASADEEIDFEDELTILELLQTCVQCLKQLEIIINKVGVYLPACEAYLQKFTLNASCIEALLRPMSYLAAPTKPLVAYDPATKKLDIIISDIDSSKTVDYAYVAERLDEIDSVQEVMIGTCEFTDCHYSIILSLMQLLSDVKIKNLLLLFTFAGCKLSMSLDLLARIKSMPNVLYIHVRGNVQLYTYLQNQPILFRLHEQTMQIMVQQRALYFMRHIRPPELPRHSTDIVPYVPRNTAMPPL